MSLISKFSEQDNANSAAKLNKIFKFSKQIDEKMLNSMTKFQEMRQKRTESICRDYITLAPEIKAKQASTWQVVCRIAEKYEVAPNTVFSALRNMKFYGGRQKPLCQEAMDNYLNSL